MISWYSKKIFPQISPVPQCPTIQTLGVQLFNITDDKSWEWITKNQPAPKGRDSKKIILCRSGDGHLRKHSTKIYPVVLEDLLAFSSWKRDVCRGSTHFSAEPHLSDELELTYPVILPIRTWMEFQYVLVSINFLFFFHGVKLEHYINKPIKRWLFVIKFHKHILKKTHWNPLNQKKLVEVIKHPWLKIPKTVTSTFDRHVLHEALIPTDGSPMPRHLRGELETMLRRLFRAWALKEKGHGEK